MTPTVVPRFFPGALGELYGVLHEPARGAEGTRGLVVCPPLGPDHAAAHRALRVLSEQVAREGWPVLRFDYGGTGDSHGEADRLPAESWVADVRCAVEHLQALTGIEPVTLLGARGGALLASLAAAGREDVEALVLWSPIPSGREQVRELERQANRAREDLIVAQGWALDPGPITPAEPLALHIEKLDLAGVACPPGLRRVLLFTEDSAATKPFGRWTSDSGARVQALAPLNTDLWVHGAAPAQAVVPRATIEQIVDSLTR